MNRCKCGRYLEPGESMCPACESEESHFFKTVVEVVGGIACVVIAVLSIFGNDRTDQ